MATNRYSQISTSQFDPMSMEEIFTVPLAKQKQHDQTQAKLDKLGIFDIKRLDQDNDLAKEYIDGYRSKIDEQTNQILEKGVNHNSVRGVKGLLSDKQKWLSNDGQGGQIVANYKAYQKYRGSLDDALKKGDLGNQRHAALLSQATKDYGGVGKDGKLNLEAAANRVDVANKLQTYAKDMMSNPVELERNTGYKFNANSNMFINIKDGTKRTPKDMIKNVLQNLAYRDPEITNYLSQRERLGLGTMKNSISGITRSLDAGYSVNKSSQDIKGSFIPQWMAEAAGLTKTDPEATLNWELGAAHDVSLRNNDLSTRLTHMISGDKTTSQTGYSSNAGIGLGQPVLTTKVGGEDYQLGDYEEEYNTIYDGLTRNGSFGNEAVPGAKSPEAMAAVKAYVDAHPDIQYQPKLMTSDLYKTYASKTSKLKTTTPEALAKGIALQADKRVYYDPATKQVLTYQMLQKEYGDELQDQLESSKVAGVFSPENFFIDEISDPINRDKFVSPYELVLKNGRRLMATRGDAETSSPAYKSDVQYNKTWRQLAKTPDLPQKITLPNSTKTEMMRLHNDDVIANAKQQMFAKLQSQNLSGEAYEKQLNIIKRIGRGSTMITGIGEDGKPNGVFNVAINDESLNAMYRKLNGITEEE